MNRCRTKKTKVPHSCGKKWHKSVCHDNEVSFYLYFLFEIASSTQASLIDPSTSSLSIDSFPQGVCDGLMRNGAGPFLLRYFQSDRRSYMNNIISVLTLSWYS